MNSLLKTVTRQRHDCDLNPDPSEPESSTLTTRLPSHPIPCYEEIPISTKIRVLPCENLSKNLDLENVQNSSMVELADHRRSTHRIAVVHTQLHTHTHTHTHTFNGPLSGTTWASRYQKGKTNLDFTEARDSEWQWHPLGHMQVSTSLQSENHTSTPPLSFFTGRMPFLPPNQHCQSTEGYADTQ